MKYIKKINPVTVELFQWGMEDGVTRWGHSIVKGKETEDHYTPSTKYPGYLAVHDVVLATRGFSQTEGVVPYVNTTVGRKTVHEGAYITVDSEGVKDVISAHVLQHEYEPYVQEQEKAEVPVTHCFKVNIGDWSQDGHNQCTMRKVETSVPVEQVQDAFISAATRLQLLTANKHGTFKICAEYEDTNIDDETIELFVSNGIDVTDVIRENVFIDGATSMVHLVMRIAQLDLPFEYALVENLTPNFNGFYNDKLNISIGYGLFTE
jgi:hypothetical protein